MQVVQAAFKNVGGFIIDDLYYYLRGEDALLYHDGCI
jgi:hypothetical protein